MKRLPTDPDIYSYEDYRSYVRDWFASRGRHPSRRMFAGKVGCSPALLVGVLNGDRDLQMHWAEKFPVQLGLDTAERTYFLDMVVYAHPPSHARRREAYDRLKTVQRLRSARRMDAQYLLLSRWYYPAIVELARCTGFRPDPVWIADTLRPTITAAEAEEALRVLEESGYLRRIEDKLEPAAPNWATDPEVSKQAGSHRFDIHRSALAQADVALEQFPKEERFFGTLSLALPASRLPELKEYLDQVNRQIMGKFAEADDCDRVYQLSIQLFPVTAKGLPSP